MEIYLLVHHHLYKIELPLDLSDYDRMIDSDGFMIDSKNISPVVTFKDTDLLPLCTSVTLGTKMYLFGGLIDKTKDGGLHRKVQALDTQHPEQGMQTVASLNFAKRCPCVFVARGMIYALGSYIGKIGSEKRPLPGCKGTGHFERYDPSLDQWQVLPDPPLSDAEWKNADISDCATVVGHQVFIGTPHLRVIFNLNHQDWEPTPPPQQRRTIYCASFFVQDSASLYYLHCPDTNPVPVKVFKRGLLTPTATTTTTQQNNNTNIPFLDFGKQQVVAQGADLEDSFFARFPFHPDKKLLHIGGRFFCYILSAQLADYIYHTHSEPKSRGVWINILEVPTQTHYGNNNNNNVKLRSLASFCYKINTDFDSWACHIRYSVLGTVPDSWIKAPLEKKLSVTLKHKNEWSKAEQRRHEVKNRVDKYEKKLVAVEQENRRLLAELAKKEDELARKDELVKMYEISLGRSLHGQC